MNDINEDDESLASLIKRGGIYRNVTGKNPREIISYIIDMLENFDSQKKEALFKAVLEREAIISTGIENGIALPHPRTPILEETDKPFIAVAFTQSPDWSTPDNSKVHTVFLIISKTARQHLDVLTKINFLCMEDDFYELLTSRAKDKELLAAITEAERNWKQK